MLRMKYGELELVVCNNDLTSQRTKEVRTETRQNLLRGQHRRFDYGTR